MSRIWRSGPGQVLVLYLILDVIAVACAAVAHPALPQRAQAPARGPRLPLEDREQHDGRADVSDDEEDLEQRAQGHARVGARAAAHLSLGTARTRANGSER